MGLDDPKIRALDLPVLRIDSLLDADRDSNIFMKYRDIRIANCEDAAKRVFEARRHHDEKGVRTAQVQLG